MKYKVGDLVLITAEYGEYPHPKTRLWHVDGMNEFHGKVAEVTYSDEESDLELYVDGVDTMFWWHEDWVTPYVPAPPEDNDVDMGDLL